MRRRDTHRAGLRVYPYIEAYPRFDVQAVRRAKTTLHRTMVWRNRLGHQIGRAVASWYNPELILLQYSIVDSDYIDVAEGIEQIPITYKGPSERLQKCYAICNECNREVNILIYRDENWRCSCCHGLKNRSALMGTRARKTAAAQKLAAELRDPVSRLITRPSGMRQQIFETKRSELQELETWLLARGRLEPSADYQHEVTFEFERDSQDWGQVSHKLDSSRDYRRRVASPRLYAPADVSDSEEDH